MFMRDEAFFDWSLVILVNVPWLSFAKNILTIPSNFSDSDRQKEIIFPDVTMDVQIGGTMNFNNQGHKIRLALYSNQSKTSLSY